MAIAKRKAKTGRDQDAEPSGNGLARRGVEDHDFVGAAEIEGRPGTLVQQVAIELIAKFRDAARFRLFLGADRVERDAPLMDLLGQAHPSQQAALALHQVIGEVNHQADAENRADDDAAALANRIDDEHPTRESRATRAVNAES